MKIEIKVPELGDNVAEATFVAWLRHEGQAVAAGEPVAEIMTDKVNVEVESPAAGILAEVGAKPDDVVAVGAVLAVVISG